MDVKVGPTVPPCGWPDFLPTGLTLKVTEKQCWKDCFNPLNFYFIAGLALLIFGLKNFLKSAKGETRIKGFKAALNGDRGDIADKITPIVDKRRGR